MFTWVVLIIVISIVYFLIRRKIIIKEVVVEGVVIGVLSGLVISYVTDGDFKAIVHSPIIKFAKLLHMKVQYVSKNWINIKAEQIKKGIYNINATNVATGASIRFEDVPITQLPPDLKYHIVTNDVVVIADQKYYWESEGNLGISITGKFHSAEQMANTLNPVKEVGVFKSKRWKLYEILVSTDFNANGNVATREVSGPKPLLLSYLEELKMQYKDKTLFYDFGYSFINFKPTTFWESGAN